MSNGQSGVETGTGIDTLPATGTMMITGIGVVAPNGMSTDEYFSALLRGKSGIDRITRFDPSSYPATLAGEIRDFDPAAHLPGRLLPQTDHMTRLSLVASAEAFDDAGVEPAELPRYAIGVITASSAGGFEFGQRELQALWSKGGSYVSAYQSFAWFYAVNTGQISIRHGLRGPSGVLVTEQAGGLDAVAKARHRIRGGTPLIVTGAVDGSLCPWGWHCQLTSGRLSRSADPRRAYLPFDVAANGYVPGEGGAILIAEDAESAAVRGVQAYGEVVGYAATFDPRPGSGRQSGLRRAIELALADAEIGTGDVDVVFADAAGVDEADHIEATALAEVFGQRAVAVTAPKTTTGRLLAGGGALDVATALLSLRHQVIPPTINVTTPAHPRLIDLVCEQPRQARLRVAVVIARGLGGFNSVLVLRTS